MARSTTKPLPAQPPPEPPPAPKPITAADIITALLAASHDETKLMRDLINDKSNPFVHPEDYGPALCQVLKDRMKPGPAPATVPMGMV